MEESTFDDMVQEIKRFLGYCCLEQNVKRPCFACFANLEHYKSYMDWLMNTRGLKPQTIMNYINTAINVLKFLSQAPRNLFSLENSSLQNPSSPQNLNDIITILRQVKNQLKKLIGRFKPPTSEELQKMEKWFVAHLFIWFHVDHD